MISETISRVLREHGLPDTTENRQKAQELLDLMERNPARRPYVRLGEKQYECLS